MAIELTRRVGYIESRVVVELSYGFPYFSLFMLQALFLLISLTLTRSGLLGKLIVTAQLNYNLKQLKLM